LNEFGRYYSFVTVWSQGFAHEFFVGKRTVRLCGIAERNAPFDGPPNKGDSLLLVDRGTVAVAQSHAAQPNC
jgi:hypothetical protein